MKIIEDKHIYPGEKVPVLEHYKEKFDLVKICFLPFIQIDSESNISSRKASQQISLEKLKTKDELFKNISGLNAEIYESNESYPKAAEILESGKIIDWKTIISGTDLLNYHLLEVGGLKDVTTGSRLLCYSSRKLSSLLSDSFL